MINYKVRYGEYSLDYWLHLILSKEIKLPNYQRFFVWTEDKVIAMIDSISKGLFIPPVTIASYDGEVNSTEDPKAATFLLDGQQRLTAILLSYLGVFPKEFHVSPSDMLAVADAEDDEQAEITYQNWSFKEIQNIYNGSIDALRNTLKNDNKYKKITAIDEAFLKSHFVGFSYIRSKQTDKNKEKEMYSSIFRSINISPVSLSAEEKRAALYWLAPEKVNFFRPTEIQDITVNKGKMDFIRYLAMISEYNNIESARIAVNIWNKFEEYYEAYVMDVINDANGRFGRFSDKFLEQTESFTIEYKKLNIKDFKSIIVADYYFFGIVYWVLLKGKKLKNIDDLKNKLDKAIKAYSSDKKSPNKITQIRSRLGESIEIYREFTE